MITFFALLFQKNKYDCSTEACCKTRLPLWIKKREAFHPSTTCNTQRKPQNVIMMRTETRCPFHQSMPTVASPLKNYDLILNNWWQLKRCPSLLFAIILKAWQLFSKSYTLFPQNIHTVSQFTVSRHLRKTYGTDLFKGGESKIEHNARHHATSNNQNEISLQITFKSISRFRILEYIRYF